MHKTSLVNFQRLLFVVCLALLTACGGGGGGDGGLPTGEQVISQAVTDSQPQLFIDGAGIKGPLAFASVELFALDTRFSELYDKNNPVASAATNAYAEITGLEVPAGVSRPYIMVINGRNAVDRNTGKTPVIRKLVTIIPQYSLDAGIPVYATPYTTLAYHMFRMERRDLTTSITELSLLNDLARLNEDIIQAIGFGMPAGTDIFTTPPIITEDTTSAEEQQLVINYRASIEALSSMLYEMYLAEPDSSTDARLTKLARDLQSDGVIDGFAGQRTISVIDTAVLSQNPLSLDVPNTGYLVGDIVAMMDEERSLVGTGSNVEFLKNDISLVLTPALLNGQLEADYTEPVGNITNSTLLSGLIASTPVGADAVFAHNYDNDNLGTYTSADLDDHWNTNDGNVSFQNGTTVIVKDPNNTGRNKVMRVAYKKGVSKYKKGGCCSGTQWMTKLKRAEELYLSYDVMFEDGFDFSLGGKLPGLYGGDTFISGGEEATGYDGWTGRMMFHEHGTIIAYMYHADMPNKFGENFYWENNTGEESQFIPGKWHRMEMRYVMNDPGVANGYVQAWLDGEPVLDTGKKLLFRNTDAFAINGLVMTTFFGGSWPSPKDQYAYFDNFVISTKKINP